MFSHKDCLCLRHSPVIICMLENYQLMLEIFTQSHLVMACDREKALRASLADHEEEVKKAADARYN